MNALIASGWTNAVLILLIVGAVGGLLWITAALQERQEKENVERIVREFKVSLSAPFGGIEWKAGRITAEGKPTSPLIERVNHLTDALVEAQITLNELAGELTGKAGAVEDLKEEIQRLEALSRLREEDREAVAQVLRKELTEQSKVSTK